MTVRKLDPHPGGYIGMFKDMKSKNEYHIIVDCDMDKVTVLLHEVSSSCSNIKLVANETVEIPHNSKICMLQRD